MEEKAHDSKKTKTKMSRKKFWLWVIASIVLILITLYFVAQCYFENKIRQMPEPIGYRIANPDEFIANDWLANHHNDKQQMLISNITPDEIEKKLLLLLALPEGQITKTQVEQIFAVSLLQNKKLPDMHEFYSKTFALKSLDGDETNKKYGFKFGWIYPRQNLPCMDSIKFAEKLRQNGWIDETPLQHTYSVQTHFFYKQPTAQLRMRYDSRTQHNSEMNCVSDIYVANYHF